MLPRRKQFLLLMLMLMLMKFEKKLGLGHWY